MKLVSAILVVVTLGISVTALADRADKKAPIHEWTGLQQYFPLSGRGDTDRSDYGYHDVYGAAVLTDELGDKLTAYGKYSFVELCMNRAKPDATSALLWAMCGPDVKELDAAKIEADLTASRVDDAEKKRIVTEATAKLEEWNKLGASIEGAAKTDKGLTAVLALGSTARSEWSAFAGKNKDQLALLDKLQDAVRANKDGLGGDCMKATVPPFQKLVHASKPPWDEDGDIMDFYYRHLPATTEAYIAILSYAACVLANTSKGKGPYTVAGNRAPGSIGMIRRGPRTLTIAKAYEEAFKPKFADRDLRLEPMRRLVDGRVELLGTDLVSSIGTPTNGKIAKVTKKDEDETTVAFAGDKVETCLQWKETNKVSQVNNGNVSYEKQCMKRGMVDNQEGETEIPTILIAGIAKGNSLTAVFGFPVVAYKSKEKVVTAIWGVAK